MTLKQQVNLTKMPSVVAAQPEKPSHYTYLKSFRTEQCKEFQQHRCKQHRPYTCFNWHFPNQRRRRSIRKRDGSFNYSANVYCTQYDESNGSCPDGDSCPFLHRNVGDTERHYHLRYFKTEQCAHGLNSSGHCNKNGPHCMFAHGPEDCRKPVFDVTESESGSSGSHLGVAGGEKYVDQFEDKTSLLNPKWNDPQYVAAHYKTERCPKWSPTPSGRMCRQGLMCPYFHSNKDRRRSFASMKYRSIACPMVKNKDEWGDPEDCDRGDSCPYCHTRMELQYHPDVYRSLKCDMMNKNGQCVKGIFCAFLHTEGDYTGSQESLSEERSLISTDSSTSSVNKPGNGSSQSSQIWNSSDSGHGLSDITFPSGGRVSSKGQLGPSFSGIHMHPSFDSSVHSSELSKLPASGIELSKLAPGSEFSGGTGGFSMPTEQLNGFALAPGAELSNGKVHESMLLGSPMHRNPTALRDMWLQQNMSGLKLGDPGPIGFPPGHNMPQLRGPMHTDAVERVRRQQILLQQAAHTRSSMLPGSMLKMDESIKSNRINGSMMSMGIGVNEGNNLDKLDLDFDCNEMRKTSLSVDAGSPARSFSSSDFSPSSAVIGQIANANGHTLLESPDDVKPAIDSMFFPSAFDQSSNMQQMLVRMRMDLDMTRRRLEICDEEKRQITSERDAALEQITKYKAEDSNNYGEGRYLRCLHPLSNLNDLSVPLLQQIETQLKSDMQRIKLIILDKAGGKCLNCLDKNASLRLPICRHKVLCEDCYMKTNECPTCQTAITSAL